MVEQRPARGTDEQYFTADPSVPFERETFETVVWGNRLRLTSGSGVYAKGRLDLGTGVLLEEEPPAAGRVLDLGCGYGVIGLAIAKASPETTVVGVDVNERAVRLATENSKALGLADRCIFTTGAVDGEFDEIWSNPPIRIGKEALHALLLQWLPRLKPGGRAVMVVGRNLGSDPLQRWLIEQGYPTERVGSSKGFRVLETRPSG
ncbi:MFS transporter [Nocardioides baekrokdamisoli]|uniref:MFS transporter n=1 Tax=Nocardioides baekrokdamisoli TaxID=1804624 RepID=A0A3G9J2U8_9ACTN|nr:methyltransferase [Nocardioides baekrokdamisoli]BBH17928.1 MFS transporter [Nocardioides baekrokdamisoli]